MDCDAVVVGAGAAGLVAARDLARSGYDVIVLEARDRYGGRLLESDDPRARAPIELGGEFVHGRPAITYRLLDELGTTVVDNAETAFVFRDGALHASDEDPFEAAGALLATALERETDESIEALVARRTTGPDSASAGVWTRRLVAGFDAADPARASARAVASEWAGAASADGSQSRPVGGYAPLVAHLVRSLPSERVGVRFGRTVSHIARERGGVRVRTIVGDRVETIVARAAIVTVPHGVLLATPPADGAIVFEPPLPDRTRRAIEAVAMGPVVKVVLRFRTAFWETLRNGAWRDGAFFNGDEAFPTMWTQLPIRATTLTAWAGGPAAERLGDLSPQACVDRALDCAGIYFGDRGATRTNFECGYFHDWQHDPFARGAYSYVLVGGEGARAALRTPIDDTVWLAGEATASDAEGGTVAGALESGARAAREIANILAA